MGARLPAAAVTGTVTVAVAVPVRTREDSVDQSVARATTSEITGAELPAAHSRRTVSVVMPCADRWV